MDELSRRQRIGTRPGDVGIWLVAAKGRPAGLFDIRPLLVASQLLELADYKKMNQVRARVDAIVKDPTTAAALKPWYRQFCKRPCFHDEYLQTYNRPNVHLVDTHGKGVERLTKNGVAANGREYELDCLIFATGFEVGCRRSRFLQYDAVGRHFWSRPDVGFWPIASFCCSALCSPDWNDKC